MSSLRILVLFCLLGAHATVLSAQKPAKPNAADIHQSIKKLNVLGSVLYVAAHPDDENQRLISYCANEKLFEVTYLSLTRGDGGQNLIGPELRELLGVLRTEELLMARSVDGGKQRFSRANDFGFSKNPEETLTIWNKDAVLADVVWAIRQTQPDIILNRFYHDKKYDTHGHHTASAMLSVEAFDLAGKSDAYPEQLKYSTVWQPKRIFFNTSWWFFGSQEKFNAMDKSNLYPLDLGVYLPLKGKSNNEIAAEARSMHRCQGFGAMSSRGESIDWFDFIKGEKPTTQNIFEGINTSWSRVEGGEKIGKLLSRIDAAYRPDNPAASVADLLEVMQLIEALPDSYWKRIKLPAVRETIKNCLGLYLESTAAQETATPGETVKIRLEAVNRSRPGVQLTGIKIQPGLFDTVMTADLVPNKVFKLERSFTLPQETAFTAPYWLQQPYSSGMYTVPDQEWRGLPETRRNLRVLWQFRIDGKPVEFETEQAYKKEEPAIGEVWQPFDILPPVTSTFDETAYIFTNQPRMVKVVIRAGRNNVSGELKLEIPNGWKVQPASRPFELANRGATQTLEFTVTPGTNANGQITASAIVGGQAFRQRLVSINYPHIPLQQVLLNNSVPVSNTSLVTTVKKLAYYMGAGDDVPAALRQMGVDITLLTDADLTTENLRRFDVLVLGIRAYNTRDYLKFAQSAINDYVKAGGVLVMQYNNSFDLVNDQVGPLPLKLSRSRVTDEQAEVRFLLPEHPVLNTPNKLTAEDFQNWVQERGLYFAGEWAPEYVAPLSMNDPGEKPSGGALLVAPYGNGQVVYTTLSFFRQLPAGVPGAYRLFANLISLGGNRKF